MAASGCPRVLVDVYDFLRAMDSRIDRQVLLHDARRNEELYVAATMLGSVYWAAQLRYGVGRKQSNNMQLVPARSTSSRGTVRTASACILFSAEEKLVASLQVYIDASTEDCALRLDLFCSWWLGWPEEPSQHVHALPTQSPYIGVQKPHDTVYLCSAVGCVWTAALCSPSYILVLFQPRRLTCSNKKQVINAFTDELL